MLDTPAKRYLDPVLDAIGKSLAAKGATANGVTIAGFVIGVIAAAAIANQFYLPGLMLILASRLCDGLDGAVARATRRTDLGGYLDIVFDFAFYGMIPLAFALAEPGANALTAAVLLLSFYVNGASFLAFAVMAEKRGLDPAARGSKSFLFSTGLAEASETLAVFAAMCLFPTAFPWIAVIFAGVVFYTAASRIAQATAVFR
jgi:phosphatidylglycerophosphate synthase